MRLWLAAAILAASTSTALGHGEQPHAGKGIDYSKAEHMPFGRAADPRKAKRTVRVEMTDQMRFHPAEIMIKRGEVVRFVPVNKGQVMHEMVLGTMDELKKHAELMRKHPGMEHDEPHMAHVAPGKQGVMGWQFTKAGEFFYGCLIPGHFEAGMIGKVTVTESQAQVQPYAGQEARELKSLSAEEVKQYLAGAGMRFARSAELNHFPGPMHVLELADQLALSAEQRAATRQLMDAHKAEARARGAKLVEAEAALEHLFRSGRVEAVQLQRAVRQAAALQGEYRLSHLETHRRMRALLTEEQVAAYDRLRGYTGAAGAQQKHRRKH